MNTRTEIINHFINKYHYKTYLEIGVDEGYNFERINCPHKVGVDPELKSKATIFSISDDFFKQNKEKFDIIFLDGLHHNEQLRKDIQNSLNCLNENGTIILHDMTPYDEKMQKVPREQVEWTGDCWKAFVHFRRWDDLEMYVVDVDHGVGIIRHGKQKSLIIDDKDMTWINYQLHHKQWLNLMAKSPE